MVKLVGLIGDGLVIEKAMLIRKNIVKRVEKSNMEYKDEILDMLCSKLDMANYFINNREKFENEDLSLEEIFIDLIKYLKGKCSCCI